VTALIQSSSSKEPGGPYRKPRADFYTVALVLALIAIILAIVCLWVLMGAYDKQFKGAPVPTYSAQALPGTVPIFVSAKMGLSPWEVKPEAQAKEGLRLSFAGASGFNSTAI
jgi:hypothetical protein